MNLYLFIRAVCRLGIGSLLLLLCSFLRVMAVPDVEHDEEIKEVVSMGFDTVAVCIDQGVVLTCSDEFDDSSILEYKWIEKATNRVVGTTRSVTVYPRTTTTYKLIVKYILKYKELIKNGDFELGESDCYNAGNNWWPDWKCRSFESDYVYVINTGSSVLVPEGTCKIAKNARTNHYNFAPISDHTSGKGYMLVANGDENPDRNRIVWKQTISGIEVGKQYAFSAWAASVGGKNPPMLDFRINNMPLGGTMEFFSPKGAKWEQLYRIWTANDDEAVISLINKINVKDGNDFTIDDVSFAPVVEGHGEVEVKVLPQLNLNALGTIQVCEGRNAFVQANVTGSNITAYEWTRQRDGVVVSNSSILSVSGADLTRDAGIYTCKVTGICGSRSEDMTLYVRELLHSDKLRDTVWPCEGEHVTFTTEATGYNPSYLWSGPSKAWSGTKTPEYSNPKIAWGRDAGEYHCRVSNMCGVLDVYRVLMPGEKLKITDITPDQVVCKGSDVAMYVRSVPPATTVKWIYPDRSEQAGASFTLRAVTDAEMGVYQCQVWDHCNNTESGSVRIGVAPSMSMLGFSCDTSVCENSSVTFKARFSGAGLIYQWSGPDHFTANTADITIPAVTAQKVGVYSLRVTDSCGFYEDYSVSLSLLKEYDNLTVTPSPKVCPGSNVTLEVSGGKPGFSYEWSTPKGVKCPKSQIQLTAVDETDAGRYVCRVKGVCQAVEKEVMLTVNRYLSARAVETDFLECPGASVVLAAEAEGVNFSYEWLKKDVPMGTGSRLNLNNITVADTGQYLCRIRSACGDTVLYYNIVLREPVKIVNYTPDKYVRPGESVALFVNAIGDNNRTYEWLKNESFLFETGSNRLTIFSASEDAVYTCKVSACNTETANIRVYVRDYYTLNQDTTVVLCEGGGYSYRVKSKPDGWCPESRIQEYWIYNGRDTVSKGPAFSIEKFSFALAGEYVYHLDSECGNERLSLIVEAAKEPRITSIECDKNIGSGKNDIEVCEGETIRFTSHVDIRGLVTFEWSKDRKVIVGETDSILVVRNISLADQGSYSCRVISAQCGESIKSINLVVRKKLTVAPIAGVGLCPGDEAMLQVQVSASLPSTFIWKGPDNNGWVATNADFSSTYTNPSIGSKDMGSYECRILNVCGNETVTIPVVVDQRPVLTEVAQDDTVCLGADVKLCVDAEQHDLKYQWILPDNRIVEQKCLTVNRFSDIDAGEYVYSVGTPNGCFQEGGKIVLRLHRPLGELSLNPDTIVCENGSAHLWAYAEGDDVKYEWRGPGNFYDEHPAIHIPVVTEMNTGKYEVVVTDICGNDIRRGQVNVKLWKEDQNWKISRDTVVCESSSLKLLLINTDESTVEWRFNGELKSSVPELLLNQVTVQDTGRYIAVVNGLCRSKELAVHVGLHKQLTVQEPVTPIRECPGGNIQFEASADGEQVRYTWMRNGREVGYRDSVLSIEDIIPGDAGMYRCVISSLCETKELDYKLEVKERTRIISYTPDKFVTEHDPVRLVVRAEGYNNAYVWTDNEGVIAGNDEVLNIPDIGMADTLQYKIRVAGDCGVDSATITIKIGQYKPLKETNDPDTLCQGGNYTYVANIIPPTCYGDEDFTYEWSRDGVPLKNTTTLMRLEDLQPEDMGRYSCRIKGDCGEMIMHWNIYVMQVPVINDITPDAFIVEGASHRIQAIVGGDQAEYNWTWNGLPYSEPNAYIDFPKVDYDEQGIYRITATNACGSTFRDSELKVWRKTTIISYPSDVVVCQASDTVFQVEALGAVGMEYRWYHNGELMSVPMKDKLYLNDVEQADAGEYKCVVSGRGGVDSCYIHLSVLELPQINILGDTVICENRRDQQYIVVTNEARVMYFWDTEGGVINGRSDLPEASVSWTGRESIRLGAEVISLTSGCSNRLVKDILLNPLPEVSFVVPDTVGYCRDTLKLDRAYPWGGVFQVNGVPDDIVRFLDKNIPYNISYVYTEPETGCSSTRSDSIEIAVAPYVTVEKDSIEWGWCAPVTLRVEEHTEGKIVWSGDKLLDVTDVLNPVFKADSYIDKDIQFKVELTDKYLCQDTAGIVLSLLPSPMVKVTPDTTVGICSELVLSGYYETKHLDKVEWSPLEDLEVNDLQATILYKDLGENLFKLTVTDVFGCSSQDTALVEVLPAPEIESREVCQGDSIVLDAGIYPEYVWSDGYPAGYRVIRDTGRYELLVKDQFGCEGKSMFVVHPLPTAFLPDTLIFEGQQMTFEVGDEGHYGPYEIAWQDGSFGTYYIADKEGYYHIRVKDNIGCTATDTAFLEVRKPYIAAPDAFLPSSGGENSKFYLKEVNFVSSFEMFIYDRWGQLMFKTKEIGYNGGWDGGFKGVICQPGAYVWVAYVNGKEIGRGTVMLIK